jgi:imidazole glycerol phosphate synthase subunit HisF
MPREFPAERCAVLTAGVKTGKTAIEQISYIYGVQAVVVRTDSILISIQHTQSIQVYC